jgi:nicotinate-nucleotide adenylyltransferase
VSGASGPKPKSVSRKGTPAVNPVPPQALEKIGLLGGSFDPPHFGHLVMAEEARVQLGLDRVVFLIAGVPPHKLGKQSPSAPEHRLAMTRLAIAGNEAFETSEYELTRGPGPTYTIETLRHFDGLWAGRGEIYFVLGLDSFLEIRTWRDPERFLEHSHLIVATRAGYDRERMDKDVPKPLLERLTSPGPGQADGERRVWLIDIPPVATSSTELRSRQRRGASIRYLVPDAVWHYIQEQRLYRSTDPEE